MSNRIRPVSYKTFLYYRLKPGSMVYQPHICSNRLSFEQTSISCLKELTLTHPSSRQGCMQRQTNTEEASKFVAK